MRQEEKSTVLMEHLRDMAAGAEECVTLMEKALLNDSLKCLDLCLTKAKEIHQKEKHLTPKLIEQVQNDPLGRVYFAVPAHLERIGDFVENVLACARTKINEGIPFSDLAVAELNFLFERIREILKKVSGMIVSRNTNVYEFVKEAADEVTKSANDFATAHEERLIKGLCAPKASSLFLDILDAIKGIAWHSGEIARKLCA